MKATHLRKNLFGVLRRAAQTGKPVEIESKGRKFQIIALKRQEKFAGLQKHPEVFSGDLESLISIDWMKGWLP
jgi:prevent-host-death family protein